MGMYTEIKVKCVVKPDPMSLRALQIMFDWGNDEVMSAWRQGDYGLLPGDPLFSCPRWTSIGHCGSAYFEAEPESRMEDLGDGRWSISSISNLKNYDDEIALFFAWLRPMVEGKPGDVIGHEWYEEAEEPTLVRL